MVKAQELRIGNIIEAPNGEWKRVENINENSFNQRIDGDGVIGCYKLELYKGIVLSPEILEKCGFVKNAYYNHKNNPYIPDERKALDYFDYRIGTMVLSPVGLPIEFFEVEYCPLDIEERTYIAKVFYLHQLQNLIFALTGEELEVNL